MVGKLWDAEYIRADQAEADKAAAMDAMREQCAVAAEETDLTWDDVDRGAQYVIAAVIRSIPG